MPLWKKKVTYSTVPAVSAAGKKEIPPGLWTKCKSCNAVIYRTKLNENLRVCPQCNYHHPVDAPERIKMLTDQDTFAEIDADLESIDVIEFAGTGAYSEKLKETQEKTGLRSAVVTGLAKLDGKRLALGVMDFRFMGASMGSVVGEKVTRLTERSLHEQIPLVIVTASGGARMQEGLMSLFQMAKTSGALALHHEAGLPYIVVMTHPTTAGVSASFASLGDIILAETDALIGFAGPRVIKQTTQSELPEGFQRAEFLQKHGFIDRVIHRSQLRHELSLLLDYFSQASALQKQQQ